MYTNHLTVAVPGWSSRSYELLKLFILGLKTGKADDYQITKVIYRFEGKERLSTSGMWLFGRNDDKHALFFAPDLTLGFYSGIGSVYGGALLDELGVATQMIAAVYERIGGHKPHEVVFKLKEDGMWHISHKLLVHI